MMSSSVVTASSVGSSSRSSGDLTVSSLSGDEISKAARSVVRSSICLSNGFGLGISTGSSCMSKFSMSSL